MWVEELESIEYAKRLVNVPYGYMKEQFCEYNKDKMEQVKYLLFKDNKKERFLVAIGRQNKKMLIPFSAPFSLIGEISKETELIHYKEAIDSLKDYAYKNGFEKIQITFPPFFYDETKISYWLNAILLGKGNIKRVDLNYAIDLKEVKENGYASIMDYNAKRNLRVAKEKNNQFMVCNTEDLKRKAYEVIKQNREFKGYPLKMTYDQVAWTAKLLNGEFFCVGNGEQILASAIIFESSPKIAQVIYWGDIPYKSEYKAVNFLAEQLVNYYVDKNFSFLDIGPSTEEGIPNYGLCKFKESIGCNVNSKITVELK